LEILWARTSLAGRALVQSVKLGLKGLERLAGYLESREAKKRRWEQDAEAREREWEQRKADGE